MTRQLQRKGLLSCGHQPVGPTYAMMTAMDSFYNLTKKLQYDSKTPGMSSFLRSQYRSRVASPQGRCLCALGAGVLFTQEAVSIWCIRIQGGRWLLGRKPKWTKLKIRLRLLRAYVYSARHQVAAATDVIARIEICQDRIAVKDWSDDVEEQVAEIIRFSTQ